MDLCGLMRVESINGKKYILAIVDDYSRFMRVKFLRSKDEAPEVIIKYLKQIQVCLNATVRNVQTNNGTEFVNHTLREYYENVRISHQTSVARTPQQNGIAEAVNTACYTQNRSLIRPRYNKTSYELMHNKKLDLSYLHVFGSLCYPTNDSEDLGKLKAKADIGIFVVQIVLWYLDSSCSKHMIEQRSYLINFVSKFFSTVRFGNDQIAKIIGYGDSQLGNVTISRVYYVEGLRHNLFSVGQFCDSDIEVAFRKHTCYVRNLNGDDLLSGSRDTNFYTISLDDMLKSSLICRLSKASRTKSWLWYQRLSHLNFSTLNQLVKQGLVRGLPKLKFEKDHLCSACSLGKSKKSFHKPKADDTNQEKLYLLHMDLCGLMRVESINGKKYILAIVDDYSRFMRVKFLRSKDEAPEVIIKYLKQIQVCLNAIVYNVRTNNGTEFVNHTLREYYENVRISHQTSVARTPQQNGIAEAVNTACYTQNRSLIRPRYNKTSYELMHNKKLDLSYLHVFGSLCYPTNDSEDLGKLKAKADIGIFVGYAPTKKALCIYNKRTRPIMETIHVAFDKLTTMASEQFSSGPAPQLMTPGTLSS
ncbi:retrovirus-related pol polyprotein from transposon TNT 1-94 [Tanacetum coccineum]|uniref:Retrovirus-related pol polyprotein from transposon TNT 1-94 n=1 Tax=Tanacetum coccineum TaxID=301880 RepID=A0ABQ4WJ78_9ASTR